MRKYAVGMTSAVIIQIYLKRKRIRAKKQEIENNKDIETLLQALLSGYI
jgi:uncharacterized UPF0160 family protein